MNIIESKNGYAISTTMGGTEELPQKGKITVDNDLINILFSKGSSKNPGPIRMIGKVNFKGKIIDGKAQDGNGTWKEWTAIKQKSIQHKMYGDTVITKEIVGEVFFPNMAFGDTTVPKPKNYFIKL